MKTHIKALNDFVNSISQFLNYMYSTAHTEIPYLCEVQNVDGKHDSSSYLKWIHTMSIVSIFLTKRTFELEPLGTCRKTPNIFSRENSFVRVLKINF